MISIGGHNWKVPIKNKNLPGGQKGPPILAAVWSSQVQRIPQNFPSMVQYVQGYNKICNKIDCAVHCKVHDVHRCNTIYYNKN